MLSVNPHLPTRGREKGRKGRETYKLNIKTTLLIILIILREIKQNIQNRYCVSWSWVLGSHQRLPGQGSLGLDSAVDGNWSQECMDRNLDQGCKQNGELGPLQKAAMDEESEIVAIPHFKPSMACMAWNTSLVNIG